VNAAAGLWQVAQDCPAGSDRLVSKNNCLPSETMAGSAAKLVLDATTPNKAAAIKYRQFM
jgi:hypothetical protein